MKKLESLNIVGGNIKCFSCYGKGKHRIMWPYNSTTKFVPQRIENTHWNKYTHTQAHSSPWCPQQPNGRSNPQAHWWMNEKQWEGMHCCILQHEWTFKMLHQGKEARHKSSHIVWFQLYEISTTDKSVESECKLVIARGWGRGMGLNGSPRSFTLQRCKCFGTRQRWWLYNSVNVLRLTCSL